MELGRDWLSGIFCCFTVLAIPSLAVAQGPDTKETIGYEIPLASRTFVPAPGIETGFRNDLAHSNQLHGLVQLTGPLELETLKRLNATGIDLLEFVYGTTYIASMKRDSKAEAGEGQLVRWIGELKPDDKIEPDLRREKYATYGINYHGDLTLIVVFHKNTSRETAVNILNRVHCSFDLLMSDQWKVVLKRDQLRVLAAEDEVKWIQQGPFPYMPLNDQVRKAIDVDAVQGFTNLGPDATYTGLDGKGVTVVNFDGSNTDPNHDDFWLHDGAGNRTASRLVVNTAATPDLHSTHVVGIIGGSGYQSDKADASGMNNGGSPFQWRGMAPNANLLSLVGGENYTPGYYQAINQEQAEVSNHSYVQNCGQYDATANGVDEILRGDASLTVCRKILPTDVQVCNTYPIPARSMVWSAGNNGAFPQYCSLIGYFSLISSAKNPIVVASTNADDLSPASRSLFSSIGPTVDGRLKPDVSAPGCKINDAVTSARASTDGYLGMCGTSMAAPATTGTVALLLQQWHKTYGPGEPLPSSMKVALIQGATDLVDTANPHGWPANYDTGAPTQYFAGPDYATGYGLINAVASRDIVAQRRIVEDKVRLRGQVNHYQVRVPAGAKRLRVTIAWDDEPGSLLTSETASKLVNDLDLVVQESGANVAVLPWVLPPLTQATTAGPPDPIAPTDIKPAHHGVDHINNVEQVEVQAPHPGTYEVFVKVFSLPMARAQSYSIAADFGLASIIKDRPEN